MSETVGVVYNACYGGFGLSPEALSVLCERKNITIPEYIYRFYDGLPRHDPDLVAVVRELGKRANGAHAALMIEEVPLGARYRIEEYDGSESVILETDQEWITADPARPCGI
jgi:hypothetical protein